MQRKVTSKKQNNTNKNSSGRKFASGCFAVFLFVVVVVFFPEPFGEVVLALVVVFWVTAGDVGCGWGCTGACVVLAEGHVIVYDFNRDKFVPYNVIPYFVNTFKDRIKILIKKIWELLYFY